MSDLIPMLKLDALTLVAQRRSVLLAVGMGVLLALWGGPILAVGLLGMLGYMTALNLFHADEAYRLKQLYGSLPVRRRTVMASHYVVAVALVTSAVALGLLVEPLRALLGGEPTPGILESAGVLATALVGAVALVVPLVIRFGARTVSYVTLVAVAATSAAVIAVRDADIVRTSLAAVAALPAWRAWLALPTLAILLYSSSRLSTRLYARQDH